MDNKYNIYITGRPNEGDELIAENVKSFYIPFFVKDPLWINSLVCAYGKDTEKLDELVGILGYVGYDTKKIRNILNDQLAEKLEDENLNKSQDIKRQNRAYIPTNLANLWFGCDN